MKAIRHKLTTNELVGPPRWDVECFGSCTSLPIIRGSGFMTSYWIPTWKEKFLMLIGRPVRLVVAGCAHPPVAIDMNKF